VKGVRTKKHKKETCDDLSNNIYENITGRLSFNWAVEPIGGTEQEGVFQRDHCRIVRQSGSTMGQNKIDHKISLAHARWWGGGGKPEFTGYGRDSRGEKPKPYEVQTSDTARDCKEKRCKLLRLGGPNSG